MVKDILKSINMENLHIEFERNEELEKTNQDKRLIVEFIKSKLVRNEKF